MKKLLFCLLAVVTLVSTTGCSKKDDPKDPSEREIVSASTLLEVEATPITYEYVDIDVQYFCVSDTTVCKSSQVKDMQSYHVAQKKWSRELSKEKSVVFGYKYVVSLKKDKIDLSTTLGQMALIAAASQLLDEKNGVYCRITPSYDIKYSDGDGNCLLGLPASHSVDLRGVSFDVTNIDDIKSKLAQYMESKSVAYRCVNGKLTTIENFWGN